MTNSSSSSDPLVAFLRACLDEDERVAHRNTGDHGLGGGGYPDYRTYDGPDIDAADDFIFHFNPARVLAEVEAKRRILEMWEDPDLVRTLPAGVRDGRDPDEVEAQVAIAETVDDIVRVLTLPYADHSNYDPAWAPLTASD